MEVPFYDHGRLMARDRAALMAAMARVIDGGLPDWGPELGRFETALARLAGVDHAIGCVSGTQALALALRALGVGPGDLVATVANTDGATPSAILSVGARPVFVDIEPATRCMDPARLGECLAGHPVKAVLSVDMHGHPADLPVLGDLAREAGAVLLSDACLSLGATLGDRPVTALADVACTSFGAGKMLPGVGPGGACLTSDPALARRIRMLAGYGQDRSAPAPWAYEEIGMNVRMSELQAALLPERLKRFPAWLSVRRAQAALYLDRLKDIAPDCDIGLPCLREGVIPAWRNFVITHPARDRLAAALARDGIGTGLHYCPPMADEPAFPQSVTDALPVTRAAARVLLCLPIGPHLDAAQTDHMLGCLASLSRTDLSG